jgi:hypothetical protein
MIHVVPYLFDLSGYHFSFSARIIILLNGFHRKLFFLERRNPFAHGYSSGDGCGIWNIEFYGCTSDHISVLLGFAA